MGRVFGSSSGDDSKGVERFDFPPPTFPRQGHPCISSDHVWHVPSSPKPPNAHHPFDMPASFQQQGNRLLRTSFTHNLDFTASPLSQHAAAQHQWPLPLVESGYMGQELTHLGNNSNAHARQDVLLPMSSQASFHQNFYMGDDLADGQAGLQGAATSFPATPGLACRPLSHNAYNGPHSPLPHHQGSLISSHMSHHQLPGPQRFQLPPSPNLYSSDIRKCAISMHHRPPAQQMGRHSHYRACNSTTECNDTLSQCLARRSSDDAQHPELQAVPPLHGRNSRSPVALSPLNQQGTPIDASHFPCPTPAGLLVLTGQHFHSHSQGTWSAPPQQHLPTPFVANVVSAVGPKSSQPPVIPRPQQSAGGCANILPPGIISTDHGAEASIEAFHCDNASSFPEGLKDGSGSWVGSNGRERRLPYHLSGMIPRLGAVSSGGFDADNCASGGKPVPHSTCDTHATGSFNFSQQFATSPSVKLSLVHPSDGAGFGDLSGVSHECVVQGTQPSASPSPPKPGPRFPSAYNWCPHPTPAATTLQQLSDGAQQRHAQPSSYKYTNLQRESEAGRQTKPPQSGRILFGDVPEHLIDVRSSSTQLLGPVDARKSQPPIVSVGLPPRPHVLRSCHVTGATYSVASGDDMAVLAGGLHQIDPASIGPNFNSPRYPQTSGHYLKSAPSRSLKAGELADTFAPKGKHGSGSGAQAVACEKSAMVATTRPQQVPPFIRASKLGRTDATPGQTANQRYKHAHMHKEQRCEEPQPQLQAATSYMGVGLEVAGQVWKVSVTAEPEKRAKLPPIEDLAGRTRLTTPTKSTTFDKARARLQSPSPNRSWEEGSLITASSPSESGEERRSPRRRRRPRRLPSFSSSQGLFSGTSRSFSTSHSTISSESSVQNDESPAANRFTLPVQKPRSDMEIRNIEGGEMQATELANIVGDLMPAASGVQPFVDA
jgi:hypothetical protein